MTERKRDFRWVKWLSFLVLVVIVAVIVVVIVKNNASGKNENDGQQIVKVNESGKTGNSDEAVEEPKEEKAPQYEGENPNRANDLTGVISYAGMVGSDLVVRVNINQFLQSGNCDLKIIKDGTPRYSETVKILESVTTSTCDGYKIPVDRLPGGKLQIEVTLESDGKKGKIESEVEL